MRIFHLPRQLRRILEFLIYRRYHAVDHYLYAARKSQGPRAERYAGIRDAGMYRIIFRCSALHGRLERTQLRGDPRGHAGGNRGVIRIAHAAHGNHEPRHVTGTLARITWFRRRSMSARKIRRQLIRLQCQHHLTFDLPRQYQIETLRKLLKRQGLHDLRIDAPLGV